jgi:hypothetical protein
MITSIVLLNPHTTVWTRTLLGHLFDLDNTGIILNLALTVLASIVLLARLARMKRLVVCSANEEVARPAAENVAFDAAVVDLAGTASGAETVPEIGYGAEDAAGGELVEPVSLIRL